MRFQNERRMDFPPPLSLEQTIAYFRLVKQGNKKATRTLIESNLRLVIVEAYAFLLKIKDSNYNVDFDDVCSIGTIGLIKAVKKFDVERGIKFSTYATKCIQNELLTYVEKEDRRGKGRFKFHSLERIVTGLDNNQKEITLDIKSKEPSIEDGYEQKEQSELVRQSLTVLSEEEKEVIMLYFGLDEKGPMSQQEITTVVGRSQAYISKVKTRSLGKMKRYCEERNIY